MKRLRLLILLSVLSLVCKAAHISGGEMYYEYLSSPDANTDRFRITLRLFRDCNTPAGGNVAPMPTDVIIGIFDRSTGAAVYPGIGVTRNRIDRISLQNPYSCILNPPAVCYDIGYFITTVDIPKSASGYIASYQTCCRVNGISNVVNNGPSANGVPGATYACFIPGTSAIGANGTNSSPVFSISDTALVCAGKKFYLNFGAADPDGDSLSYSFCSAYGSGGITDASTVPPGAPSTTFPYYGTLTYTAPYSGTMPLGTGVTIDPETGLISGIAPTNGIIVANGTSFWVVNVCIAEWRNGVKISDHRKDFLIKIANCDFADAELPVEIKSCDGFTVQFANLVTSNQIKTWYWDFGVPGIISDVSTDPTPAYTYADTGVYRVMLIVNRDSVCTDTAYTTVRVFPGFFPGFIAPDGCKNVPIQMTDTTKTKYGSVDYWFWNYGDGSTSGSQLLKNPQHTYSNTGQYTISMIVGNSKGCLDTVSHVINILDKPPLQVSNDTTICDIDTLQLFANGTGSFSWTPNYNINNTGIPDPLVSPDVNTTYYVTLTNGPGCFKTDSVVVTVKSFVTVDAGNDTTICLTDPVVLNPVTDGLYYLWSPASLLNDPTLKNPTALPTGNTTFTLTSSIGKCFSTDNVTVSVVPYPLVTASPDTAICFGDSALLSVTGNASTYKWFPGNYLSDPNSTSTFAYPPTSLSYIVSGTDTLGCPKPTRDTVTVIVIPPVPAFAGNDTAVVVGQPLQFNGSGGDLYQWAPPTGLNQTDIPNPVGLYDGSFEYITYTLLVSTVEGCFAYDTVTVRIFKTQPDIFVPTGFTPNNDGLNDVLRAIPVGIQKFDYFRVYNRWGQLVFSSTNPEEGWDGKINGYDQSSNTFVWQVQGTDYTGKMIKKKGTVTLIR